MILFFNVYLEPNSLYFSYDRGRLPTQDKVDVFKYCLTSVASIYKWSQVIIKFKLHDSYKHREEELIHYIKELFPNHPNLSISTTRNEYQKDWKATYEQFTDDDLIFFSCNHDHIFFDYGIEYFESCIDTFKKYKSEEASLYLTHYPEMVEHTRRHLGAKIDGPLVHYHTLNTDSFLIITRNLFKHWWIDPSYSEDKLIPRSDYKENSIFNLTPIRGQHFFSTSRELFRHFDGYSHTHWPENLLNICPPIAIPPRFFEKDTLVIYNFNEYYENAYNINVNKVNYSAFSNENCSDHFCLLKEIPKVIADNTSAIYTRILPDEDFDTNFENRMRKIRSIINIFPLHRDMQNYFYNENEKWIKKLYGKC